jgi:salicylate hydroxylase
VFHRIQKLIHLIPSTLKWLLADREPLEKWVHDSGKVVLLGDSCHPMLVCPRIKANVMRNLM